MKRLILVIALLGLVIFAVKHLVAPHAETAAETSLGKPVQEPAEASSKENNAHTQTVQLSEEGSLAIGILTQPMTGTTIPTSTLVWFDGKPYVFVETEALHFRKQEVSLKSFHNDTYEVDGLPAQGNLVIQGAQMLMSEEQRGSVEGAAQ